MLGAVKITKNNDPDRYVYFCYGIGFDSHSEFSFPDGSANKNAIIFGVDMKSSVHIDNKKKDILVLGFRHTQGLYDTMLKTEGQYSINFSGSNRKFCLSLHYIENKSFLFVNGTKIYQFKAKDTEKKTFHHV